MGTGGTVLRPASVVAESAESVLVPSDRRFRRELRAARRGDSRALAWLWGQHAGPIAGFLRARGTPEVDEVVNDVFVAAFGRLGGFEGDEAQFRAWLFAIARNKRVDELRRLARRPQPAEVDGARVAPDDVEASALERVQHDDLRGLLGELTSDQRDVIIARFISGLSLEQTASALDKPVGAVKALQHRAVNQLRKKIGSTPYPDGDDAPM